VFPVYDSGDVEDPPGLGAHRAVQHPAVGVFVERGRWRGVVVVGTPPGFQLGVVRDSALFEVFSEAEAEAVEVGFHILIRLNTLRRQYDRIIDTTVKNAPMARFDRKGTEIPNTGNIINCEPRATR